MNKAPGHIDLIYRKYNKIKESMPKQDHEYILIENDCAVYGNTIHNVALYFRCKICNCLLVSPTNKYDENFNYKFNSDYNDSSFYDIDDLNKFLTCKENIIKSIIE